MSVGTNGNTKSHIRGSSGCIEGDIMNIQDNNKNERIVEGIVGIPNSDIREIKLNYI